MSDSLVVNEVYLSLQGESTLAGLPCVFVRLTGCPLRCSYCDTAYAFTGGQRRSFDELLSEIERLAAASAKQELLVGAAADVRLPLVELTGGEPLAQPAAPAFLRALCDRGFTVLLETSGALDIVPVDRRVRRIVDVKCPSSGEADRNRWGNLAGLQPTDELKFVIGTAEDYAWAKEVLRERALAGRCPILFSWVNPLLPPQRHSSLKPVPPGHTPLDRLDLVGRIIADALPVRFQLQMHKVIWAPAERGV